MSLAFGGAILNEGSMLVTQDRDLRQDASMSNYMTQKGNTPHLFYAVLFN